MEEGKKIKLEGTKVIACKECSSRGKFIEKVKPRKKKKVKKKKSTPSPSREEKEPEEEFKIEKKEELVENFPKIIRREREGRDMKQEELGKKINEPASLISRIESGKFKPSPDLVRKIEKALKIELLTEQEKISSQKKGTSKGKELTLGDMVVIKDEEKDKEG